MLVTHIELDKRDPHESTSRVDNTLALVFADTAFSERSLGEVVDGRFAIGSPVKMKY